MSHDGYRCMVHFEMVPHEANWTEESCKSLHDCCTATTAATIFVFQNVVKKWRSWTEQFQRLEAYLLSPVSYEHRRGTAAHRGRSALYGSKWLRETMYSHRKCVDILYYKLYMKFIKGQSLNKGFPWHRFMYLDIVKSGCVKSDRVKSGSVKSGCAKSETNLWSPRL